MSRGYNEEDRILSNALKENEDLRNENRQLRLKVIRLDLFNKILEREVVELKSVAETRNTTVTDKKNSTLFPFSFYRVGKTLLPLIVVSVVFLAAYFIYTAHRESLVKSSPVNEAVTSSPPTIPQETQDKIADKKQDTNFISTRTLTANDFPAEAKADRQTDSLRYGLSGDSNKTPSHKLYKVKSKAYFHDEPDPRTKRKAFIIHWNNAVLSPQDEVKGFIYVVFTNHLGQTSRGWLRKDNLIELAN